MTATQLGLTGIDADAGYTFSGHQTFGLRFGWLTKLVRLVSMDPAAFFTDEAPTLLGVGKNMVAAIRYWSEATGVTEFDTRRQQVAITPFGKAVFGEGAGDPFLEDPRTLWLLHWQIASRSERTSTWFLVFNRWRRELFSEEDLVLWLTTIAQGQQGSRATRNTIKRDVSVFLRSYLPSSVSSKRPIEETFDSPLVDLGLVDEVEKGVYRIHRRPRPTLTPDVFACCLHDYWTRTAPSQATMPLERVMYAPGAPGTVHQLAESACVDLLLDAGAQWGFAYDDTAGQRTVQLADGTTPLELSEAVQMLYRSVR